MGVVSGVAGVGAVMGVAGVAGVEMAPLSFRLYVKNCFHHETS